MPSPYDASLRGFDSPVPTHTSFVSAGEIAMAPIEPTSCLSNTGFHVVAAFVLRHTPPPAAPM